MSNAVRDEIVKRLSEDLIGPKSPDEVLKSKPTDVYMTGILWPAKTEFTMIEDDSAGDSESDDDSDLQNSLPMHGQKKASSMGITFAVSDKERNELLVTYSFGTYVMQLNDETGNTEWKRKHFSDRKQLLITDQVSKVVPLELEDCNAIVDLHVRSLRIENGFAVTVTMMNCSDMKDAGSIPSDSFTVFQAGLSVEIEGNGNFLGLTDPRIALDEDEESAMLLYS